MVTELAIDHNVPETTTIEFEDDTASQNANNRRKFKDIIGQSKKMKEIFRLVENVGDSDSTIIINGETGTGKGLIAKAIHKCSDRKRKPFVQINCGAIPENLLESELFGHVRGAFTGATSPKQGKFEIANGGTIFLDEIGDMSPNLQVKLLRVLEDKEFEQVGGCKTIKVDVRVIAATHRDLEEEVQKGNFREDLFYRLYVIPITLPSLRERKSDIPVLASHFLKYFNKKNNKNVEGISVEAMKIMMDHSWNGNVRELKNLVEGLVVLKGENRINPKDLPKKMMGRNATVTLPQLDITQNGICLSSAVSEFEKSLIIQCLEQTKWVKKQAAKLLQVNRTTLVEKIKRHQLQQTAQ